MDCSDLNYFKNDLKKQLLFDSCVYYIVIMQVKINV